MELFEPDSGIDPTHSDTGSFETPEDADLATDNNFDIGIVDGQDVDLDGDGVPDGVAHVSYADLDGDGVDDYAQVTITADTDGDGSADTVIIMDQYDTDGDGLADHVDMTYGVDTDGDGKIDTSEFSSGTITNIAADSDGDGRMDTVAQTVTWDSAEEPPTTEPSPQASPEVTEQSTTADPHIITASIDAELFDLDATDVVEGDGGLDSAVVETAEGNFVLVPDTDQDDMLDPPSLSDSEGQVVESAFVDPATGQWVSQSPNPT